MIQRRITLAIPTFNRLDLWRRQILWQSLLSQSCTEDLEVLICDDGSTDDTVACLAHSLRATPPPFRVRLFRTLAPKSLPTQASALPDNVLFKEASGDWIVHLDDDGWVHRDLVRWVRSHVPPAAPAIWWGRLVFCDPPTLLPYPGQRGLDPRIPRHRIPDQGVTPMRKDWAAEWGALWITRMEIVRRIGGHEMENIEWRGGDSRFGARIRQVARCYFAADAATTFWHVGIPWQRQQIEAGRLRDVVKLQRLPQYGTADPAQIVVNGGDAFWTSGLLDSMYEEIKLT
ncbi:MAG: glycosyltransferase family A protein [Verrucomicrobiia bacterium]